jgi:hypothetical protein
MNVCGPKKTTWHAPSALDGGSIIVVGAGLIAQTADACRATARGRAARGLRRGLYGEVSRGRVRPSRTFEIVAALLTGGGWRTLGAPRSRANIVGNTCPGIQAIKAKASFGVSPELRAAGMAHRQEAVEHRVNPHHEPPLNSPWGGRPVHIRQSPDVQVSRRATIPFWYGRWNEMSRRIDSQTRRY